MWIKPALGVLLVLLRISVGSGFFFLMKDQGRTRRTLHSRGVRVTLAAALVAVIAYGFYSGQLRSKAPWDAALQNRHAAQQQGSGE